MTLVRRLLLAMASMALAGALASPTLASSGVSVDLGRIDITEQLAPGSAYNLPTLGVRNPGTERTRYVMVASPVVADGVAAPASAWFTFDPTSVTLEPGETQRVRVRLVLPADAAAGEYTVLVGAQIAPIGEGASVGAAAAARTTFTILPATGLQGLLTQLGQAFADTMPWSAIVPAGAVLLLVLWLVRRRFTFRIGIERRGAPLR